MSSKEGRDGGESPDSTGDPAERLESQESEGTLESPNSTGAGGTGIDVVFPRYASILGQGPASGLLSTSTSPVTGRRRNQKLDMSPLAGFR